MLIGIWVVRPFSLPWGLRTMGEAQMRVVLEYYCGTALDQAALFGYVIALHGDEGSKKMESPRSQRDLDPVRTGLI